MKDIVTKIEDKIVQIKEQNKNLDTYVFTLTPTEYDALCKCYGVNYNKCTIFYFMGVAMSVRK